MLCFRKVLLSVRVIKCGLVSEAGGGRGKGREQVGEDARRFEDGENAKRKEQVRREEEGVGRRTVF